MRTFITSLSILVACAGYGRAQSGLPAAPRAYLGAPIPASSPAEEAAKPSVISQDPAPAQGGRIWGSLEYLLWWTKGMGLPPLITTSPPGTPLATTGVLGVPTTSILFGDSRVDDGVRSGGRFTLGYWLNDCQTCGIGGDFFFLQNRTDGFGAGSTGDPILARPFINSLTGLPAAEIIAYPGLAQGGASVSTSSEFLGADAYLLHCLCSGCGYRFEGLVGYRYLQLREGLGIEEQLASTSTEVGAPPPGTTFGVFDQFNTVNRFHGGDLGLWSHFNRGRWSLDVLTKVALGCNERIVNINGSTVITVPGGAPTTSNGGLLALDSNIGRHEDHSFAVVPEVRFNVGYQVTDRLKVFVGYTFLYWTAVARPGDQIDLNVNPNLLPPTVHVGPNTPAFHLNSSDFWAQGVSFGLAFNF